MKNPTCKNFNVSQMPIRRYKNKMIKNLVVLVSFIVASSGIQAATTFTGTYSFASATGNVSSLAYNGTAIPNVTVGNLLKVGVTTSSNSGNSRATGWTLDPGTTVGDLDGSIGAGNYYEFSLTAASGYTLDMTSFTFGVGRSAAGPRSFQWRSSFDNYATAFSNYTSTNAALSNTSGALSYKTDATTSATGNVLNLSSLTGLSGVTFRFYGYNSENTGGTGGLEGNFTFAGAFNAAASAAYTWTGNGSGGTWQNGQSGNFGTTYNNATDSAVTFSGTSGDVTVSGAVQAGSLTFTSGGYALNSGSLTVGQGSITTDTGTTTINSVLEGTAGLIKSGAGALVLTGANTVAGAVTITGGTLQIGSDGALGDAANDIANNGTLKTTSNTSLGSGRDFTGSGSLDIGGGTTLTVNGAFNQTATTLANSGTLDLQGATRSVGNLTVNAAGTVNGSGAISATGLTTGLTSGTASINTGIVFSSGDKTLNVASGGTLDLNGALSNGGVAGRIAKTGAGTLILSADNNMGGIRIGSTGAIMTDGGKVILESSVVGSQGQAIQHNFGTLEASTALVMNSGLSIGGRFNGAATLAGGDMEFQGQSAFFRGSTGTIGQLALNVNNNTTLSGGLGATSGTGGTATGVTLGGSGTLNISGNSSTFTDAITTADTVKLVVNNTLGAGVNVGSGSLLSGSGKVGAITGAGTVGPGNSPGILTATSVNPTAGTDFKFEFTALSPTYTSATASGNDLLHLTAASPFAGGTFTSGNIISIYLNSASITNSLLAGTNTTFSGGFFVDGTYGLAAALNPASFAYYTTMAALGTGSAVNYGGTDYYLLNSEIAAKTTLSNTAVASAAFSTGTVAGTILTFNAVPEPSAQSLLAFGMVALVAVRSLRRKQS